MKPVKLASPQPVIYDALIFYVRAMEAAKQRSSDAEHMNDYRAMGEADADIATIEKLIAERNRADEQGVGCAQMMHHSGGPSC